MSTESGSPDVLVTERGLFVGYNVFEGHSVLQPGRMGPASGGERRHLELLTRAAVAAVFIQAHEDHDNASSDGPMKVPLARLSEVAERLMAFARRAKSAPVSAA